MKFKKAFKKEHPETIGETDSHFDLSNYTEWLERKIIDIDKKNKIQLKTVTDIINHPKTEESEMDKLQSCRRFIKGFDYELSVFND